MHVHVHIRLTCFETVVCASELTIDAKMYLKLIDYIHSVAASLACQVLGCSRTNAEVMGLGLSLSSSEPKKGL